MRNLKLASRLTPLFSAFPASSAFAHSGHESQNAFLDGLMHPLTGLDHLGAILLVGLWTGLAFSQRLWLLPSIFLTSMMVGFSAGAMGLGFAGGEQIILASLVVFGVLALFARGLPQLAAAGLVALFAFAHGHAHGAELGRDGAAWQAGLGMIITSASLLVAGIASSRLAGRASRLFAQFRSI